MTDVGVVARTRIFDRFNQALNNASLEELVAWRDALRGGATIVDLLQAAWKAGDTMSVGRADQKHLLQHVYGRGKGGGWWGREVEAIATEGLAQTITRMLFDPDGQPRKWAKRVDGSWMLGYTHHFHVVVQESEQQVTMTWVTPPKGDHPSDYARYLAALEDACENLSRPRDPDLRVASNFTRLEDIWVITDKRWALTHGVDKRTGRWRPVAKVERNVSKTRGQVVVARQLCEDYKDRFPQKGGRGGKKGGGGGRRSAARTLWA
jgi:hypothetical protein